MFQRTTPARLTIIVLALILGILLGLALLPSGNLSGAALSESCLTASGLTSADCSAPEQHSESIETAQFSSQASFPYAAILLAIPIVILTFAALSILLKRV